MFFADRDRLPPSQCMVDTRKQFNGQGLTTTETIIGDCLGCSDARRALLCRNTFLRIIRQSLRLGVNALCRALPTRYTTSAASQGTDMITSRSCSDDRIVVLKQTAPSVYVSWLHPSMDVYLRYNEVCVSKCQNATWLALWGFTSRCALL